MSVVRKDDYVAFLYEKGLTATNHAIDEYLVTGEIQVLVLIDWLNVIPPEPIDFLPLSAGELEEFWRLWSLVEEQFSETLGLEVFVRDSVSPGLRPIPLRH